MGGSGENFDRLCRRIGEILEDIWELLEKVLGGSGKGLREVLEKVGEVGEKILEALEEVWDFLEKL